MTDLLRHIRRGKMQLRRIATFNLSITTKDVTADLRPCQRAYLGESNARRLLKRSQLCKNSDHDEPIFALHEEAATEAAAAAAAVPFETMTTTITSSYSVQCYATHAEDEQKRKDAEAAEKEKLVLLNSINSSRQAEGNHPLILKLLLCKYAQEHADLLFDEEHHCGTNVSGSTNSVMVVMSPSGARVARLVSQPRIGALACGEMWYGGKYRRHLYNITPENVGEHPDDCPCHLRIVFETIVDEGWNAIGIGRSEDARWVVELGQ